MGIDNDLLLVWMRSGIKTKQIFICYFNFYRDDWCFAALVITRYTNKRATSTAKGKILLDFFFFVVFIFFFIFFFSCPFSPETKSVFKWRAVTTELKQRRRSIQKKCTHNKHISLWQCEKIHAFEMYIYSSIHWGNKWNTQNVK